MADDGAQQEGALEQLIDRMRDSGLRPDARGIADALWLSRWLPPSGEPAAGAGTPEPVQGGAPSPTGLERTVSAIDGSESFAGGRDTTTAALRMASPQGTEGRVDEDQPTQLVRVPTATAFSGLLPLQRALRPLQRYRPPTPPRRRELDENATADVSARCGLVVPVFRGVHRRETTMQLLMDVSSSTVVWEQLLEELRQVCEQIGAFRDVHVHFLYDTNPQYAPYADAGTGSVAGPGPAHVTGLSVGARPPTGHPGRLPPLRPADQLRDPTGRRLTLVVSDCAGPLWRSGRAQQLLYHWARVAPIAVVQPLPQRMWGRTHLPARPGTLTRRAGGDALGVAGWGFRPRRAQDRPGRGSSSVAVPVLSPTRPALGAWARLVAGPAVAVPGSAAAWVYADHPGARAGSGGAASSDPAALLDAFNSAASPAAQQLVVYFSAVPLALPVMQLVQRAMLPQTGPAELAEVLLGGVLTRATEDDGAADGGPWYTFRPGVGELLLRRLGRGEAALILKHCSRYVEHHFGRRARNFPALAAAYLAGSVPADETDSAVAAAGADEALPPVSQVPQSFAHVARQVLFRFQPRPPAEPRPVPDSAGADPTPVWRQRVDQALGQWRRDRLVSHLLQAVQLLRDPPEPAPDSRAELADVLITLWDVTHDPRALAEAEEAAVAAVAAVPGPYTSYVRGRVDRRRGDDHLAAGRAAEAGRAFADADARLAEAVTGLLAALQGGSGDPRAAQDAVLEHTDVLERRARLGDDPGAPGRALGELTGLRQSWPPGRQVPAAVLSRRARLLLDLAAAGPAGRADAQMAVAELEAAARTLDGPALVPVLFDLARAYERVEGVTSEAALDVLYRALRAAAGSDAVEADCRRRLARSLRARWDAGGDRSELARAEENVAIAQNATRGTPEHPVLLTEWGDILVERVLAEAADPAEAARAAGEAVRVLREALRETRESDPALPGRRVLFGHALHLRYTHGGALTDLYEAEWVLGLAARQAVNADDHTTAAKAWLEHGDVQRLLSGRMESAAASYLHAADAALESTAPDAAVLAARAHHLRGEILEAVAGRPEALDAYRAAWEQWRVAGTANGPQAALTRRRILELERSDRGDAPGSHEGGLQ
ncbi:SAV_2336 N-terminal domain-related protein [Streptomyces mangrovisoli]|uniref:Metallophosphoesterase n=1 Tax=Streptomyces mangrovisoli TaxID=1428628 RepID=A0A1J4NMT7_9ACTN|nr:SAV_2336 N-terminal domain-related protein [Streptomyces mangrovisoli]OIJ63592.1 hypothetical protein WN71_032730 [Streptomyces mangrovisoli]